MNPFDVQRELGLVSERFAAEAANRWVRKSRILVLVDGRMEVLPFPSKPIASDPAVRVSVAFGPPMAITKLREFSFGFSSFTVTIATRDGPEQPGTGYDQKGFRFSDAVLANYDQVWLFGIWPDADNPTDDAIIDDPSFHPLADDELEALARWMDRGGGLLATGDHWQLGATIARRVPRASVMRAWSIADQVPSEDGPTRFQTTRPVTIWEKIGYAKIPFDNEFDTVAQSIKWVPYERYFDSVIVRPHPVLCHPTLGPIDIMPDHMHEGRCYDFASDWWQQNKRDTNFTFGTYSNEHFPTINGRRPLPQVIAWGRTPGAPPLKYESGPQPERSFPMIAAYDGQQIGLGRVVVDSTWHHWFDWNVSGLLKQAYLTGEDESLEKITRYWINVAVYLASPAWRMGMLLGWLKSEQLRFFGRQAISLTAPAPNLGAAARNFLNGLIGPCWVSEIVDAYSAAVAGDLAQANHDMNDDGSFALTSTAVEDFVLGEVVRFAYSDMDHLRAEVARHGVVESTPLLDNLYEGAEKAGRRGFSAARAAHREALKRALARTDDVKSEGEDLEAD